MCILAIDVSRGAETEQKQNSKYFKMTHGISRKVIIAEFQNVQVATEFTDDNAVSARGADGVHHKRGVSARHGR
jgi:hypothetical protein